MATKSSDDPMDLGGFMQNFVLSNPFRDMPCIPNSKELSQSDSDKELPTENSDPVGNSTSAENSRGSSPDSNHSNKSREDFVLADENGQVLDTPKAHVGSNVVFAAALKLQKVSFAHSKVQKWLKNNYVHAASYPMCKDAKELAAEVQEQFPHITNRTLSKIMTFTFPNCSKITNISGFHGYKGLVGKPQPEDYCNLDLLKAVSHSKLYGSITEAGQLYNVPVSSVASLHFWHPDLASIPVDMSVADELETDHSAFSVPGTTHQPTRSYSTRRSKRRSLPVDYCDPDNLTDLEEDISPNSKQRHKGLPSLAENKLIMNLKEEVEGAFDGDNDSALTNAVHANEQNQAAYSLLRNLLKRPRLDREDSSVVTGPEEKEDDGNSALDLQGDVVVKSEPVDPGYGDGDYQATNTTHKEKSKRKRKQSTDKTKSSEMSEVDCLQAEVQRLKGRMNMQIAKNQKQEVQLLLSQKEVLNLKSSLCSHQVTFTELSQDFSNLQEQFCALQRKFKRSMDQLEKDKEEVLSTKKKFSRRPAVNGSAS